MANRLKLAMLQALLALFQQGWSQRRIAKTLGIDRGAVARYWRRWRAASNPAIPDTGSDAASAPKPAIVHTGSADAAAPNPAIPHTGSDEDSLLPTTDMVVANLLLASSAKPAAPADPGRHSECAVFHDAVKAKLDQGLSAQRIWQDLCSEHGFAHSYYSVLRFVRKLTPAGELPFRRMECAPGEEKQRGRISNHTNCDFVLFEMRPLCSPPVEPSKEPAPQTTWKTRLPRWIAGWILFCLVAWIIVTVLAFRARRIGNA